MVSRASSTSALHSHIFGGGGIGLLPASRTTPTSMCLHWSAPCAPKGREHTLDCNVVVWHLSSCCSKLFRFFFFFLFVSLTAKEEVKYHARLSEERLLET